MVKEGPVLVLNIFTRYLSEVKVRGVVLSDARYQEEAQAAKFLGYESRNLNELDVSFRREAYKKLGNIFRPPIAEDLDWLPALRAKVFGELASLDYQQLYVPLGIGWHVDHVLTHKLFEPWYGRNDMLFYEDAPYCCIPHSTRYRLNELATYPADSTDQSLALCNETSAWWQASMAYAETALMKNLQPWIVRQFAVPVVTFYLHRLIALHRRCAADVPPRRKLNPIIVTLAAEFEAKVSAMALYRSQFSEFFLGRDDCVNMLGAYSQSFRESDERVERYWLEH